MNKLLKYFLVVIVSFIVIFIIGYFLTLEKIEYVSGDREYSYSKCGEQIIFCRGKLSDYISTECNVLGFNLPVKSCSLVSNDYENFKVLGYGYAKDNGEVYYYGVKLSESIKNVDVETFKVLSSDYVKDNLNVYYRSRNDYGEISILQKIEDADSQTFNVMKEYYAKDKNGCYKVGKRLEKVDCKTGDRIKIIY